MTKPVLGTGLLETRWFLISVVEFEFLFALWLLSTLFPSPTRTDARRDGFWTWFASIILFFTLGCVSLWRAAGGEGNCGCFGALRVNPWYTAALDWGLVVALILFRPRGQFVLKWIAAFDLLRMVGILIIWLVVGGPIAIRVATYQPAILSDAGDVLNDGTIVLEPGSWLGKQFPLLEYIPDSDPLRAGRWKVVLYHHDCPRCQEAIRQVLAGSIELHQAILGIALVELPPYGDDLVNSDSVHLGTAFLQTRLSNSHDWFVETPTIFELQEGIVASVEKSQGPAADTKRITERAATARVAGKVPSVFSIWAFCSTLALPSPSLMRGSTQTR